MDIADQEEYEAVFSSELNIWSEQREPLIDGTVYYVPNGDITASSMLSADHDTTQSRLHNTLTPVVSNYGAWCVDSTMPVWIQVELRYRSRIVQVATQSLPTPTDSPDDYWVTSFKVEFYNIYQRAHLTTTCLRLYPMIWW